VQGGYVSLRELRVPQRLPTVTPLQQLLSRRRRLRLPIAPVCFLCKIWRQRRPSKRGRRVPIIVAARAGPHAIVQSMAVGSGLPHPCAPCHLLLRLLPLLLYLSWLQMQ
jgi:hypothetical protein